MSDTPNLVLPYIVAAQAQKHVTHNEAIRELDAIVHLAVLDRDLSTPPISPVDGDRYLVAGSATGDWLSHEGEVAAFQDEAWMFYQPKEGWLSWIADEDVVVAFDGSAWVSISTGGGGGGGATTFTGLSDTPANYSGAGDKIAKVNTGGTSLEFSDEVPQLGVNATPDATNKFSVSSAATLLNHAGAGHQTKVNKAAVGDSASFLFQTAFSGRAEIGITGDDDFHFKVSPDGSTFHESIVLDRSSGDLALKQNAILEAGYLDVGEISVPSNPSADTARLYAKDDGGTTKLAMRDSGGTETVFGTGGGGGGGSSATSLIVVDQKASGTNGGTFTAGAWRTRDLNTVLKNAISGATVSSNQITLPAGDYEVWAEAPAYKVNQNKTRLQDVTNNVTLADGRSAFFYGPSLIGGSAGLVGSFTLAASATIELQHRCLTTEATAGFGAAASVGVAEIFSQVKIQKV